MTEHTEHEALPLVREFMQTRVKTVSPDFSLEETARFLLSHGLSNAPVVDDSTPERYLLGFISERDCLAALAQEEFYGIPSPPQTARTIMRSSPVCVSPDTDLFSVASLFINHGYRHLPVAEQGRLEGLVSRRDVLKAVLDYGERFGRQKLLKRFRPDSRLLINLRYLDKVR